MSPSLKHHLILQHAPDMTQLPLLRNATWSHANNGHFTNGFVCFLCISDGGDDGQGAGQSSDGDGHSAGDSDSRKYRVLIHYFNECI